MSEVKQRVPADWKLVNIVLIFKKGKKEDSGNYRPVSLTSVTGKVMEKIILEGIGKHLKDNTVIGHSQHTFMRGMSCLPKFISFYDKAFSRENTTWDVTKTVGESITDSQGRNLMALCRTQGQMPGYT
ncbi:rna-directed dna polymerase from mobile element jockey-like [Pitangus sulphuratus]|nr:rna-directed dna polymerase from mobile element jockey-like [Pitangus sulphuratus]